MHPDDFHTRWERDYGNSCGIRPEKLRNYLSERDGILDQSVLGEGKNRGFTNRLFFLFLLERNPVNLSMKSFSEVLLPNGVSFFFFWNRIKIYKDKTSEKIPLERKIRQLGFIFLYFQHLHLKTSLRFTCQIVIQKVLVMVSFSSRDEIQLSSHLSMHVLLCI